MRREDGGSDNLSVKLTVPVRSGARVKRPSHGLTASLSTASASRVTGAHSLDTRDRPFLTGRPEGPPACVVSRANTLHGERRV